MTAALWTYGTAVTVLLAFVFLRARAILGALGEDLAAAKLATMQHAREARALSARAEELQCAVDALRCPAKWPDGARCSRPKGHAGQHQTFTRSWDGVEADAETGPYIDPHFLACAQAAGIVYEAEGHEPHPGSVDDVVKRIEALTDCERILDEIVTNFEPLAWWYGEDGQIELEDMPGAIENAVKDLEADRAGVIHLQRVISDVRDRLGCVGKHHRKYPPSLAEIGLMLSSGEPELGKTRTGGTNNRIAELGRRIEALKLELSESNRALEAERAALKLPPGAVIPKGPVTIEYDFESPLPRGDR